MTFCPDLMKRTSCLGGTNGDVNISHTSTLRSSVRRMLSNRRSGHRKLSNRACLPAGTIGRLVPYLAYLNEKNEQYKLQIYNNLTTIFTYESLGQKQT
jgi:hypothetical protein